MRFCPEEPLKQIQVMQVHGKCHSLASPALIRWQGSQGHSQGVSLGTNQGREGWRMGLEGQTDSSALATCYLIPFQPERMLPSDFCPSPQGQESYRMGQNLRNSGIPEMLISWCETRR